MPLAGKWVNVTLESKMLKGNFFGDPHVREWPVYLPPGHKKGASLPLMVSLASFFGSGLRAIAWEPFRENLVQRVDRLIVEGKTGPFILACPDLFTALGGNQYVNSTVLGPYSDHLVKELLPHLHDRFGTTPATTALFGHSSGGYGAIFNAMIHPGSCAGVLATAPDMNFDVTYRNDFPKVALALAKHDGDPMAVLRKFREGLATSGEDHLVLLHLAMAASFDPRPDHPLGCDLPVNLRTGRTVAKRYANWRRFDPLLLLPRYHKNIKKLKFFYVDCGRSDEYFLHFGNRLFSDALRRYHVPHLYEEFDGGHRNIAWRYDLTLPRLYSELTGNGAKLK